MLSFSTFLEAVRAKIDPTIAKLRKMDRLNNKLQTADSPEEHDQAWREKQQHLKDIRDKQRKTINKKLQQMNKR